MAAMAVPVNVECVSDATSWRRPFIIIALVSLLPIAAVGTYRTLQRPPTDPTLVWAIAGGVLLALLLIAGYFLYRERRPPKRRVTLDVRRRRLEFVLEHVDEAVVLRRRERRIQRQMCVGNLQRVRDFRC